MGFRCARLPCRPTRRAASDGLVGDDRVETGPGVATLRTFAGENAATAAGQQVGRVGDRLASFAVLLPARPDGPVVLAVSQQLAGALADVYDGAITLCVDAPARHRAPENGSVAWDGERSPIRPGSAALLVVDSRIVSVDALRPALAPRGTLAVLAARGDYVIYPSAEQPEHVWRREWPLPARPGLRAQLRRIAGIRMSRLRGAPYLTVSGPRGAALADDVIADLAARTGSPGRLIGIEAATGTTLRVRQPDGDVALRLSLSGGDPHDAVGELVVADVPAIRPLLLRELASGTTTGRPWVATRWLSRNRGLLLDTWDATRRRWEVVTQTADVLQAVRTGTTQAGWARAWCDATPILPVEQRDRFADAMAPLDEGLPTGWCHGDLWPGNVVVDRRGAGVIDWDNASPTAPQGVDWLLIAVLREVSTGRSRAGEVCARMIRGTLPVDAPVAGRPFTEWDAAHRSALVVAAYVLHLRNRSLHDMDRDRLRDEFDVVAAALDAVACRNPTPAAAEPSRDPRAGQAARGAVWLGIGALTVKAAQTALLLVLAALLAPSALGMIAIATMISNVAQVLTDLGTSTALIYVRGDVRRAARTSVSVALVMSSLVVAAVWLAAPWIAHALHTSADGQWVIRGLVSVLPCYGVATASQELVRRDLAFVRRILPDIAAAVAGAAITIGMALHGHGIAGLVAGQIVQGLLTLALAWVVGGGVILPGFRISDLRRLLSYGRHLTMADLLQLALLNIDYILVARVLGQTQLGQYSLAFRLAYLPYLNVAVVISGAAFPYLCRLPDDAIAAALERVVAAAMTVLLPSCMAIALFADQIELLGTKWQPAVAVIRWLALYAVLLSTTQFVQVAVNSTGRPRVTMQLQLLHFLSLAVVLLLLVHHGVIAVAIGQCLAATIKTGAALALARRHIAGLSLQRLARDLRPVALGIAVMALVTVSLHRALPATVVSAAGLAFVGGLSVAAYLAPVWLLGRASLIRTARLLARTT
jgi:O-antigen/teichoic acid export membrane protein